MSTAEMVATNQTGTAIAQPTTIKGWLQSEGLKAEIAKSLPRHCNAERMMRIAITATTRNPKLADCDHASFMKCLLDLSQWGLEPDGRHAHLIPFENRKRGITECQLIIDYKGLVQLLYRSGECLSVHADVVREGDSFRYSMGEVYEHTPHFLRKDKDKPATAGDVYAVYCRVILKGGAVKCEVMNKDDIDSIRRRSKAGSSGPWVTDYNEMAKKTVFRRATKWLPLSAEIIDAFERDFDSPDFVEAAKQQANSLEALTLRLESRDPEPKPEPEAASSEPHAVSDLEEIRQEILAADAEKVAKLYDFYVGPNGPLGAADTSQVSAWCKSRSAELAKAGKSSGVLFDDGMSATEAGM